jgi:hypothetical protein
MSALGLGCVKTRRRAAVIEQNSRLATQAFLKRLDRSKSEKNHSRDFSILRVFTQARSSVSFRAKSRTSAFAPIPDMSPAAHRPATYHLPTRRGASAQTSPSCRSCRGLPPSIKRWVTRSQPCMVPALATLAEAGGHYIYVGCEQITRDTNFAATELRAWIQSPTCRNRSYLLATRSDRSQPKAKPSAKITAALRKRLSLAHRRSSSQPWNSPV